MDTDPRFGLLIRLNRQVSITNPEAPGYKALLDRVVKLAIALFLEYQKDWILSIGK